MDSLTSPESQSSSDGELAAQRAEALAADRTRQRASFAPSADGSLFVLLAK
jgi:hypothetical protein